jgi:hypothetical protein
VYKRQGSSLREVFVIQEMSPDDEA